MKKKPKISNSWKLLKALLVSWLLALTPPLTNGVTTTISPGVIQPFDSATDKFKFTGVDTMPDNATLHFAVGTLWDNATL